MKIKDKLISIKNDERLISARKEYGYLGYSFLLPALIMLAIYFTLGHKPIGNFSVLTLDLNAQYVYFYEALRDFVWGDSSLLYSFSRSLGGEFMGIYAYYIASPLSYIVALFPKSMMLFALLLIIVIKIGLCGLFFGFYLHKQSPNIDKSKILLFSTMYALSAYAITYQNNIMWLDGLFLLPLLTYSVERLVKEGRFKLYTVILALMMASHYYIGYMLCWYTLFCFFFTYFKEDSSSVNLKGEKLHFIKSFARIGVSTLIGIGMSAFIIGSAYYSLQFGKSEFSEPNWDFFARFDLFDLFPRLLPGAYDTVMHEGLPLLYCGVLTLLLLPIYVMAKRVKNREKVFYIGFTLLYVLIMVINPTDLVMHGFQEPNCLNYRYSFIVIFLMLVMAYKAFCEIEEHSPKKIFATGAIILALLLVAQKMNFPNFILEDTESHKYGFEAGKLPFVWVILFTIVAVFAIGALTCHLIKAQDKKSAAGFLILAVCVELFFNGLVTFASMNFDIGWGTYSSYADYFKTLTPIVQTVQKSDKTFYRSEKTNHRCTNDNMALAIKGLSNSTSTLNQKAIDLIDYLGFYSDAHWTQYLGSTPITDSIFGIKYIYSEKNNASNKEIAAQNEFMDRFYELYKEDGNYYAYKNPYALGLAFGVSEAIKNIETDFSYDYETTEGIKNPFESQNILLNALLGNSEDDQIQFFKSIPLKRGTNITSTSGSLSGLSLNYNATTSDIENYRLIFKFKVKSSGPLFLYLPYTYASSFTVFEGEEYLVSNSDHARIISLGYREKDEEIELKFRLDSGNLRFFKETDYLYTLDMDEFEHAIEKLMQTSLVTSEKSTDDHIFGSLTTHESNKTIMTTIPYDKGWKVFVDGKQVDTYAIYGDSLIAFDIESAGEHDIEFKYMPDIYVITGIISADSTIIFIILVVIDYRKKKRSPVCTSEICEETKIAEAELTEMQEINEKTEGEN